MVYRDKVPTVDGDDVTDDVSYAGDEGTEEPDLIDIDPEVASRRRRVPGFRGLLDENNNANEDEDDDDAFEVVEDRGNYKFTVSKQRCNCALLLITLVVAALIYLLVEVGAKQTIDDIAHFGGKDGGEEEVETGIFDDGSSGDKGESKGPFGDLTDDEKTDKKEAYKDVTDKIDKAGGGDKAGEGEGNETGEGNEATEGETNQAGEGEANLNGEGEPNEPSMRPSVVPTKHPISAPSSSPSANPSLGERKDPTMRPSVVPKPDPTRAPTSIPTATPSMKPSGVPKPDPTRAPTSIPTANPTRGKTNEPTAKPPPVKDPTQSPTSIPTGKPTVASSSSPTSHPSAVPSITAPIPTSRPSAAPQKQPTNPQPLGPWPMQSFTKADGKQFDVLQKIEHDPTSFTQGLTYHDGYLYESAGLYAKSTVRKVDPSNGNVLHSKDMEPQYFGEGLTYFGNNKLIQLTWKENTGIIYDLDFNTVDQFQFKTTKNEGWGITYVPSMNEFIVSDGSAYLHFWDENTLKEKRRVKVVRQDGKDAKNMNELEFYRGYLLCNIWYEDTVLLVHPGDGKVMSEYDFSSLWPAHERKKENADVLNGISVSDDEDVLYMTGKNWKWMFRVRLH